MFKLIKYSILSFIILSACVYFDIITQDKFKAISEKTFDMAKKAPDVVVEFYNEVMKKN